MLTQNDAVVPGIPPAMKGEYVVRVTEATFGPSKSSGTPMLTLSLEVVGVPVKDAEPATEIDRGGKKYIVAGIRPDKVYFPLKSGPSLGRFFEFQRKAGLPSEEVDDQNLDVTPYKGLLLRAIVTGTEDVERSFLTQEERDSGKTQGEPIKDSETGEILKKQKAVVLSWVGVYNGMRPAV